MTTTNPPPSNFIRSLTPEESRAREASRLKAVLDVATARHGGIENYVTAVSNNATALWLKRFITQDHTMLALKATIQRLSEVDDPVLITGPSGTGKEILANALHGLRPPGAFHAINCAAMPSELIESELFGHRSGSFTGAKYDNEGVFRAAKGGTVFLDEIGEAPLHLQTKLLRALQPASDGRYYVRPVGDTRDYPVNCRVVCATRRNLREMVDCGTFRDDLYARLMTFELYVTPLATRTGDIPVILRHLGVADEIAADIITAQGFTQDVALFNVRALQAYARRAAVLG